MTKSFLLPDLGEGLTEASIVTWLVAEGDTIAIDQPVVEVESAKAVVELPSPFGGVVTRLHGAPGDMIELGEPVISVDERALPEPLEGSLPEPVEGTPALPEPVEGTSIGGPDDGASEADSGSGAVLVGYGTSTDTTRLVRPAGGRFGRRRRPAASANHPRTLIDPTRRSRVVSPLVRRLALDNGFDASHLVGSADDGVVRREHVEAAIAAQRAEAGSQTVAAERSAPEAAATSTTVERPVEAVSPPARPAATAGPSAPEDATTQATQSDVEAGIERIPITGLRAVVADRLSTSRRVVPEATIWLEVDATNTVALRQQLRDETGERFSFAAIVGRFAIAALRRYPILNATISADGREIARHDAVHLGIAAQTERGLVVPVIRDASALSLRGLRDAIDDIATNHADGVFPPERLSGGTFTLNNYGGFGVDGSAPILNHPEVAMLGIGRLMDKPWVVDGEIAIRKIVTLTFVFDHRVCDGDVASGFLTTVARSLEQPTSGFADL